MVRIIGCEYRLSECEILDWLGIFGEVISENTEEPFEDDGAAKSRRIRLAGGAFRGRPKACQLSAMVHKM